MANSAPNNPSDPPNFEQSLARLDEIVHRLEEGDLGLDESLARYEEGIQLLRQSYELIERAERRIEILSGLDAQGNPVTRLLQDVSTLSLDEQRKPWSIP